MNRIERCVICRRARIAGGAWSYHTGGTVMMDAPQDSLCPQCTLERFPNLCRPGARQRSRSDPAATDVPTKRR